MEYVLTLVSPPDGLDEATLARVQSALRDLGADTLAPAWLQRGRAADLPQGLALAAASIDQGAARRTLDQLVAITNR